MTLVHILLALVGRHPQSGYELWKWLEVEGRFLRARADRSQIYRTLARLTDDGLVCHTVAESRTGPDAKIHRLTPAGVDALLAWVASPYEPGTSWQASDFMARFLLAGPLRPDSLLGLLDAEIEARTAQVVQFRDRDRAFDSAGGLVTDPALARLLADDVHRFGTSQIDHWLGWLHQERARLVHRLGNPGPGDAFVSPQLGLT